MGKRLALITLCALLALPGRGIALSAAPLEGSAPERYDCAAALLVWGLGLKEGVNLGTRATFADAGKTALDALGIENSLAGTSFYPDIIEED